MALVEASLHTLVGLRAPAPVTAGLVFDGREVLAARPVAVVGWAADGPAVAATVIFGPYDVPVSFNAVRLYHGGEFLIDLPYPPVVVLAPTCIFEVPIFLNGTMVR